MKNKILLPACLAACGLAWAAKDPVIMTVNGVDVPKSEFEYLYNKNSQQQLEPQSLEDYVETFKIYKLKVADARAAGLDTLPSYRREVSQYKDDLAAPYLADSVFLLKYVDEAYTRMGEEVEANHIMLMKSRDPEDNKAARQKADSLLSVLKAGADFDDIAVRFSQDRSARTNHGHLGYIPANKFPYDFETAVFTLPEGQLSDVVESTAGYHIIKGGKRRPARGEVQVAHILKMFPRGANDAAKARVKAAADSLYEVLVENPSRFSEIAMKESDDKNSGRQGGLLPWFGTGQMVAAFDSASFALPVDEMSKPVETPYGWHIIKKLGARDRASKEAVKADVLHRLASPQDDRYRRVRENQTAMLSKRHKTMVNDANLSAMRSSFDSKLDSAALSQYLFGPKASLALATIDGKPISAAALAQILSKFKSQNGLSAQQTFDMSWERLLNRRLIEAEEDFLALNEPDYSNLLKEYCEGTLLFEISNQRAWDKASRDKEGLDNFFKSNRENYKWDAPRVKGYLVQAADDSIAKLVTNRMNTLGGDTIGVTIRKEFPGKAQAEKVLVAKGSNPMVDALFFGEGQAKPASSAYSAVFLYEPRLINAPEEVNDVKGQVTSDYQNALMDEWVAKLQQTYPVSINYKELKKIKKH